MYIFLLEFSSFPDMLDDMVALFLGVFFFRGNKPKFYFQILMLIQTEQTSRKVTKLTILADKDVPNVKQCAINKTICMHIYKQSFCT